MLQGVDQLLPAEETRPHKAGSEDGQRCTLSEGANIHQLTDLGENTQEEESGYVIVRNPNKGCCFICVWKPSHSHQSGQRKHLLWYASKLKVFPDAFGLSFLLTPLILLLSASSFPLFCQSVCSWRFVINSHLLLEVCINSFQIN